MTEDRSHYGFPCPGQPDHMDPMPAIEAQPADYAPEPEEAETWREELIGDEAAFFDAICSKVRRAVRGYVHDTTALWVAEETLWQLRCLARKADLLDLPSAGRWRKVRS
jgi:hypothetical protein